MARTGKGPILADFHSELWEPRRIGNTYRILVKIALSDAELIVVCVKEKKLAKTNAY